MVDFTKMTQEQKINIATALNYVGVPLFQIRRSSQDYKVPQGEKDAVSDASRKFDTVGKFLLGKMIESADPTESSDIAKAMHPAFADVDPVMRAARKDAESPEVKNVDIRQVLSDVASIIGYFTPDRKADLYTRSLDTLRDQLDLGALTESSEMSGLRSKLVPVNRI